MYAWRSVEIPTLSPTAGIKDYLELYDTASGTLQPVAQNRDTARMYVCGITPYDATHIGHANTYVAFDLINRVWRDLGLEVIYTQNVTDVDDPLLERAQQTGVEWDELAMSQIDLFRGDMEQLRVIAPTYFLGAVESIHTVTELIEKMAPGGLVYQIEDTQYPDWYFRTNQAPGFGELSNLTQTQMVELFAQRGGDPDRPGKEHPLDCLLWRCARDGEPSWASTLGDGRPGWHIECTAMALATLGAEFDVQGGGSDLIFPHHEMCAAEARSVTGEPLAAAYVHSGMVALNGEKMSKSKGNLELVSRLRGQGVDPMAIRLALLDHHYRQDWEWTTGVLTAAQQRLELWRSVSVDQVAVPGDETIAAIRDSLRSDLDTPAALKAVDSWALASRAVASSGATTPQPVLQAVDALLGVRITTR